MFEHFMAHCRVTDVPKECTCTSVNSKCHQVHHQISPLNVTIKEPTNPSTNFLFIYRTDNHISIKNTFWCLCAWKKFFYHPVQGFRAPRNGRLVLLKDQVSATEGPWSTPQLWVREARGETQPGFWKVALVCLSRCCLQSSQVKTSYFWACHIC